MSPGWSLSAALAAWAVAPGLQVGAPRPERPAGHEHVGARPSEALLEGRQRAPAEPPNGAVAEAGRNATYIGPAPLSVIRCRSSAAWASVSFGAASGWT